MDPQILRDAFVIGRDRQLSQHFPALLAQQGEAGGSPPASHREADIGRKGGTIGEPVENGRAVVALADLVERVDEDDDTVPGTRRASVSAGKSSAISWSSGRARRLTSSTNSSMRTPAATPAPCPTSWLTRTAVLRNGEATSRAMSAPSARPSSRPICWVTVISTWPASNVFWMEARELKADALEKMPCAQLLDPRVLIATHEIDRPVPMLVRELGDEAAFAGPRLSSYQHDAAVRL